MTKIVLDCDPGIDDTLAILYALKNKDIKLLGLSIVCGNVEMNKGVINALRILSLSKTSIPVYPGASFPVQKKLVPAYETHGYNGVGNVEVPYSEDPLQTKKAIDFLIEMSFEPSTTLICLGPLTNIYHALHKDPLFLSRYDRVISMGGVYQALGNVTATTEYNYWSDPEGARKVYEDSLSQIEMLGLDVTRKAILTPEYRSLILEKKTPLTDYIYRITQFYEDFHLEYENLRGCVINDPLAVAYGVNPSLCQGFHGQMTIDTQINPGQCLIETTKRESANAFILNSVNSELFMKHFLRVILS